MSATDWQEVVGVVGLFVLLTAVITVTIWQLAASWRARAVLAREQEYRTLAAAAVRTQENTERHLAELGGRLTEMQSRMESLERMLAVVD